MSRIGRAPAARAVAFWRMNRLAAGRLLPYPLGVGYATMLNAVVVALN
jgi:tryptophan-rich sensory protein